MDYEVFASGLPPGRTLTCSSVEEMEELLRRAGVNQPMRQLSSGTFQASLAASRSKDIELFVDRYSRGLAMCLEHPKGTVGLLFPRTVNRHFVANGQNVGTDGLLVLPVGSGTDISTSDMCGSEAIAIPEARFAELNEVMCRTRRFGRSHGPAVIRGNTDQLHAMQETVRSLVAHPELDAHHETVSNLVAAAVAFVGHASGNCRPDRFIVNGSRKRVAKQAQEYIEEHYRSAVRIEDICRVTGVGVRTLQRCFREYFDLTISDYLKAVRLDAAHRALVAGDPSQDTVTGISVRDGIRHLGRFSVEFRKRFGKLPNEALAERPGQRSHEPAT